MKRFIFLLLFSLSGVLIAAENINGYLEQIEDKLVLRLKGTHQERGYAKGILMSQEIYNVIYNYMLPVLYNNNTNTYNFARYFFTNGFEVEDRYLTEAQAVIDGMSDSGLSLYMPLLDRDLDAIDILMSNSIVDFVSISRELADTIGACSSITSWGESTSEVYGVTGEMIITRHLDWFQNAVIRHNQLVIVHFPAEEGYQNWLSLGVAGLLGCLSAVSESGLAAFYNVGSNHSYTLDANFHPVLFSIRSAIESADYNQDGTNNHLDIFDALNSKNHLSGSIIHAVAPLALDDMPFVFEVNNEEGISIRTHYSNQLNPAVPLNNLVATNHFRTLYEPEFCIRYQNIADSLGVSSVMSSQRSWNLLAGAAGVPSNMQAMQYIPSKQELLWSITLYPGQYAYNEIPTNFDLGYLFTYDENTCTQTPAISTNGIKITNYPNPFNPSTNIVFNLSHSSYAKISIFNIKGYPVKILASDFFREGSNHLVWNGNCSDGFSQPSGIYFIQVKAETESNQKKILLLK